MDLINSNIKLYKEWCRKRMQKIQKCVNIRDKKRNNEEKIILGYKDLYESLAEDNKDGLDYKC